MTDRIPAPDRTVVYFNRPRDGKRYQRVQVTPVGDGLFDMQWLSPKGAVEQWHHSRPWPYVESKLMQGRFRLRREDR